MVDCIDFEGDGIQMTTLNQIKDVQPIRSKKLIEDMKWSLKRHCSERDYILFLIGINSGLRVGDLLKLRVGDLKRKRRVTIQEGKTKKKRDINLSNVYDEVQEYIKSVNSEWLFPSRKGDKPITPTQAYRQLNKAAEMCDINDGIGTHSMRKTFGYWHYKQFKDIAKLQTILNHSRPDITLLYIGITQEEIEEDLNNFVL